MGKPFASAVSSHVEVGIRTALKLGMTLLKSLSRLTPDLLSEVVDLFGETLLQYPALCLRDPDNYELDSLYHDGKSDSNCKITKIPFLALSSVRTWLLSYLEITTDQQLKEKIVKTRTKFLHIR